MLRLLLHPLLPGSDLLPGPDLLQYLLRAVLLREEALLQELEVVRVLRSWVLHDLLRAVLLREEEALQEVEVLRVLRSGVLRRSGMLRRDDRSGGRPSQG